ncbi:unnamed protein product, partial [Allacma fusca]
MNEQEPTLQQYELQKFFRRSTLTPRESPEESSQKSRGTPIRRTYQEIEDPQDHENEITSRKKQHYDPHQLELPQQQDQRNPGSITKPTTTMDPEIIKSIIAEAIKTNMETGLQNLNSKLDDVKELLIPKVTEVEMRCTELEEK